MSGSGLTPSSSGGSDWTRLEALLEGALALPENERGAWLDEACAGDARLRAGVESLLREELDPFFDRLRDKVAGRAREALGEEGTRRASEVPGQPGPGRTLGPYRILERLGQGGMGVVWLAERDDVGRRVALKVIRSPLADPELIRRFLTERRVLARLVHPGIARLLDLGATEDGTPWLAMDLVEGRPLPRYCDEEGLDVRERLGLFVQVCEAVAYAHTRLVVHRDIKPSNVLVEEGGTVKLLDFGIAKLLADAEGETETTRTALRAFSPEYAAPEQVTGEPVTTATDVHALGVLLFEILSGDRPWEVDPASPAAAVRAVVEREPRRLSEVADATGGAGAGARELDRDLEAICLKALARDPGRRYPSAQALADDVRRHLDGYPVEARLPTFGYRARRFIRRNRGGVAAAALVLLALGGGLGASLWQGARARAALAESEAVASFLTGLFEASDPEVNRGREIGARELLEEGSRRIEGLEGQPRVQARMLDVMARAWHGLGESGTARELAERSVEARRAALGPRHPEVASSLHTLGEVLDWAGDREGSVQRYREALEIRREALGPEDERTTLTMIRLARLLMLEGSTEEGEAVAREALRLRTAAHGPEDVRTAEAMEVLGMLLWQGSEDREGARDLLREALAIREGAVGPDDPALSRSLVPLSSLSAELGDFQEGERYIRRAVELHRSVYGDDHPNVSYRMGVLGYVLDRAGRSEEAEAVHREVLRRYEAHYPGDYPYTATALMNLGVNLSDQGRYDSALVYQVRSRDMQARLHGEEDPGVALAYHNISVQLANLGRMEEAAASARRAWELRTAVHGAGSPQALRSAALLGQQLTFAGRLEEAEEVLRETLRGQRALDPAPPPAGLALTLERLALVLVRQERPEEAVEILRESLDLVARSLPPENVQRVRTRIRLIDALERAGRADEAARLREESPTPDAAGASPE